MEWWSSALPEIVKSGAPWLLVFLLVLWLVRWQRRSYDERVAELRAHNEQTVTILRDQIDTGRITADSLAKVLAVAETTQRLVEALPVRARDVA